MTLLPFIKTKLCRTCQIEKPQSLFAEIARAYLKKLLVVLAFLFFFTTTAQAQFYTRAGQLSEGFHCVVVNSQAVTLTTMAGCSGAVTTLAAVSGKSFYITNITWAAGIVSTTSNYFLLRYGTTKATDCDTGTTSIYAGFGLAFGGQSLRLNTPIKAAAGNAVCWIHPGIAASGINVNIGGFLR